MSAPTPASRLLTTSIDRLTPLIHAAPAESLVALVAAARGAAPSAYAPFSNFQVGAAVVMADDPTRNYFTGANVENSSYGLTMCAERTAIFSAVARGFRRIRWIAISCPTVAETAQRRDRSPCGACRQVIREFADDQTLILLDSGGPEARAEVWDMEAILPWGFRLDS
jgi:cytidine deaminase